MTVSAQTPINRSTGNGVTTVFPYTFKIVSAADIEVSVDGVVKTLSVDYTLSGVGSDAGGNVTMTVAPANLASVVRRRNMALVRSTDYQDQGELPAATLDSDIDATVLMIQQVDEQIGRALTLPAGVTGVSAELPEPIASNLLGWDATGTAIENYSSISGGTVVSAAMVPVVTATTLPLARTAMEITPANIGAAASGANSDITSLTGLVGAGLLPVGSVIYHAANTPPTGYLKANGALVSRATYSALFAAIGTTFGVGDGSTTFGLPDLRGEFVRGWDDARGIDTGRVFGSAQAQAIESHFHTTGQTGTGLNGSFAITGATVGVSGSGATNSGATGGTETRPRNIALLACIKF